MTFDLTDCRCVACGGDRLVQEVEFDPKRIIPNAVRCGNCGAGYDAIWGAPFLGAFEREDVTGLIEIAANAAEFHPPVSLPYIRNMNRSIALYDAAPDRAEFARTAEDELYRAYWFTARHREWVELNHLLEGVELKGLKALDLGAGSGTDSVRLSDAGAVMTAVEYNPFLITRGLELLPDARWIGAQSHYLPFQDQSFDLVCCNAALHHMRDVRATLKEVFRVLKPGGWLLTIGDPYRPETSTDQVELEAFNNHVAVLTGINESIINIGDFFDALPPPGQVAHRRALLRDVRRDGEYIAGPFWAEEADFDAYRNSRGDMALRVRLGEPTATPASVMTQAVLSAGDYAALLKDEPAAMTRLASLLPPALRDRPFPGERQIKFELLNGWQAPIADLTHRRGYKRARWFLSTPANRRLSFAARRAAGAVTGQATLSVAINAEVVHTTVLDHDWREVQIALPARPGPVFVCELRLTLDPEGSDFEDWVFEIKDRQIDAAPAPLRSKVGQLIRRAGLYPAAHAVAHWLRWGDDPLAQGLRRLRRQDAA